ncbi:MAG: siderophore-interacting protein [Arcanobacterium sp.]|nr:siderophore-interacting protein [Arcanobacterium sp.]
MAKQGYIPIRLKVLESEKISPNLQRIYFGGSGLADFVPAAPIYDQRIKVLVPSPGKKLPELSEEDWYGSWLKLPEDERGALRTYTVREFDSERLSVDFVLHLKPGATGPVSTWAASAKPGDEVIIVGGTSVEAANLGVEFSPRGADFIELVGDETALPAIARILQDLSPTATGRACIEVPTTLDVLPELEHSGFEIVWLPRDGREVGTLMCERLLEHCVSSEGGRCCRCEDCYLLSQNAPLLISEAEEAGTSSVVNGNDEIVWETPTFSAAGEEIETSAEQKLSEAEPEAAPLAGKTYYWIAGEATAVTRIRRVLVKERGISREEVSFMGYWKKGRVLG